MATTKERLLAAFDILDEKYKFDIQETTDFKDILNDLKTNN